MLKHASNANYTQILNIGMNFIRHIHYQCIISGLVDIVVMPMGLGQMKYLVLAREDLTNQVEGRALRNKQLRGFVSFSLKMVFVDMNVLTK